MSERYASALQSGKWRYLLAGLAIAVGPAATAADSPTGGEPGVHTFVLSNIFFASPQEPGACSIMAAGGLESFLSMLPPQEQAQYADPSKRGALEARMDEVLWGNHLRRAPQAVLLE